MSGLAKHLLFREVLFRGASYSWNTLSTQIDEVASRIDRATGNGSPFIYLLAENHLSCVVALTAIVKTGRVCVPVNPEIKPLEMLDRWNVLSPGAVIRINAEENSPDKSIQISTPDYSNNSGDHQVSQDACMAFFTAATDGYPRAAILTYQSIVADALSCIQIGAGDENSLSMALLPFHHLFGLQTGIIIPGMVNSRVIVHARDDPLEINSAALEIAKHSVTHLYSVPVVYYLLGRVPGISEMTRSIETMVSGGCSLPYSVLSLCRERMKKNIFQGYGLTEASPICTWNAPDEGWRDGSVGKNIGCCRVAVLNEIGTELSAGEEGEICVMGSNMMKGYYGDSTATEKAFSGGWFHTGDIGKVDGDGYVYVTGLKKRMLNCGGNKVYPAEVERFIRIHENVMNVEVFGENREPQGDMVRARMVLFSDTPERREEIKAWCRENLSAYKVPKIDFRG